MATMTRIGFAIGLLAGAFGGLAGLGGGVVMVPMMMGLARVGRHVAHATSLVAVVATGISGAWAYASGDAVAWRLALPIAVAATVASVLSARAAPRVRESRLHLIFASLQLLIAITIPFADLLPDRGAWAGVAGSWLAVPIGVLIGGASGTLAGLLGVGGGVIVVPLLVLGLGLDQATAQGTSLAVMVPAALAGSLVHLRHGTVNRPLGLGLALGALLGAFGVGLVAVRLPELVLRLAFAALLGYMGVRGLITVRRNAVAKAKAAEVRS